MKWRGLHIFPALLHRCCIHFNHVDPGITTLCNHEANESGAAANIQDSLLIFIDRNPGAENAGNLCYFHGTSILKDGEFFESEIA